MMEMKTVIRGSKEFTHNFTATVWEERRWELKLSLDRKFVECILEERYQSDADYFAGGCRRANIGLRVNVAFKCGVEPREESFLLDRIYFRLANMRRQGWSSIQANHLRFEKDLVLLVENGCVKVMDVGWTEIEKIAFENPIPHLSWL
jgi:hypothetical protein